MNASYKHLIVRYCNRDISHASPMAPFGYIARALSAAGITATILACGHPSTTAIVIAGIGSTSPIPALEFLWVVIVVVRVGLGGLAGLVNRPLDGAVPFAPEHQARIGIVAGEGPPRFNEDGAVLHLHHALVGNRDRQAHRLPVVDHQVAVAAVPEEAGDGNGGRLKKSGAG